MQERIDVDYFYVLQRISNVVTIEPKAQNAGVQCEAFFEFDLDGNVAAKYVRVHTVCAGHWDGIYLDAFDLVEAGWCYRYDKCSIMCLKTSVGYGCVADFYFDLSPG